MSDGVALLCTLHPASAEKQDRCISLLRHSAREYYRRPQAQCTTWSYCTPHRPKPDSTPIIAGLEIYTSKQALQKQIDDPEFFQSYHETVKRERLYSEPEELVAWYQCGGFLARNEKAVPFGGVLISVTRLVAADKEKTLGLLREFAKWVDTDEPDVLTYAMFTRPKAPKEVMLFVRYRDGKAMKSHSVAPEHQEVVKKMSKVLEVGVVPSTSVWREVEDSFVTTSAAAVAKL